MGAVTVMTDPDLAHTLPNDIRLGAVHLTVRDLERSVRYYRDALGMQLHHDHGEAAHMGAGGDDLLVLHERPDAVQAPRRSGLYHVAVLVPSRLHLAQVLQRLIDSETQLQGASDHLVSEALYLSDPDGNGIEIYRDRPRSSWPYQSGSLQMAVDPLDIRGVLAELEADRTPGPGLHPGTVLGHMHLHVADIAVAEAFYTQAVGFEMIVRYGGSASFLAAGGYHHHLGINTWNGVGAPPPPPDAVGLRQWAIELPDEPALAALAARLERFGTAGEDRSGGLFVRDPSGNGLAATIRASEPRPSPG